MNVHSHGRAAPWHQSCQHVRSMTPQHSHLLYELKIHDHSNKISSVNNGEGDNSNNTNNKRNPNMIRIIDAVNIELVIRMMLIVTVMEVVIILMVAKIAIIVIAGM